MAQEITPTHIQLTTKEGPLAQVWLASNMTSSLSKNVSLQTDIVSSVNAIARAAGCSLDDQNVEPITLRVSGQLLTGVVRIFSKKTSCLLEDIADTLHRIKSIFQVGNKFATIQANTVARLDQLILQDAVTEKDVLVTPGLEFLEETSIPEGFMGGEQSMERHVQGAAAMDRSLELGRRFAPDDDLEQHSTLDLNFDLGDGQSKSWGEGTNISLNTAAGRSSTVRDHMDEDFPDDDGHIDWDLGVSEGNDQLPPQDEHTHDSDDGSDNSVELGRRAVHDDVLPETTFDFDLELDKNSHEQSHQQENLQEETQQTRTPVRRRRNSAITNTKPIVLDDESELKDQDIKGTSQNLDAVAELGPKSDHIPISNNKRLWVQIGESMDFLPESISTNFLTYEKIKRQRITPLQERTADDEELQLDISLNLDESSIHNSDIFTQGEDLIDIEHGDSYELNEFPQDNFAEGTAAMSTDMHEYSHIEEDAYSSPIKQLPQSQKIQLSSGETASKSTVVMAEQLRTHFIDNETISFGRVMSAQHSEQENITKSQVSKAFFEMLTLATADCVDLDQETTFGEISIAAKAPLYEKFIAA